MADVIDALCEKYGYPGRLLSGSKAGYSEARPDHTVFFNACIFTEHDAQQVWWGDIDLTQDTEKLQALANELEVVLVVTREMPYRFEGLRVGMASGGSDSYETFAPTTGNVRVTATLRAEYE